MDKIFKRSSIYLLLAFLVLEVLSFLAYTYSSFGIFIFALLLAAALALSIYSLEYGLLILFSEMIVGSKGYLFSLSYHQNLISWRLALFVVIIAVFVVKFIWRLVKGDQAFYQKLKSFSFRYYYLALFVFIGLALGQGLIRHGLTATVFFDFNAWLFLALLPVLLFVYYKNKDRGVSERLGLVIGAALIFLALKSLLFLYIFSHDFSFTPAVYTWIRRSGVGEITNIALGWPRVFLQSQIFAPLAFLAFLFFYVEALKKKLLSKKKELAYILFLALFLSVTLLSFSRSFWFGLLIALICSAFIIFKRSSWRFAGILFLRLTAVLALALLLIYFFAAFPYPRSLVSFSAAAFEKRANFLNNDAAVSSRQALLKPLWQGISGAPFFGQGFGSTITYHSSDPRILATRPDGLYTTYAFEWGHLGLWLKLGLFGWLSYLFLLFMVARSALKSRSALFYAIFSGLIFLTAVHVFTPYLDHPLALVYLMLSSCLIF